MCHERGADKGILRQPPLMADEGGGKSEGLVAAKFCQEEVQMTHYAEQMAMSRSLSDERDPTT